MCNPYKMWVTNWQLLRLKRPTHGQSLQMGSHYNMSEQIGYCYNKRGNKWAIITLCIKQMSSRYNRQETIGKLP